jgi:opacity protein-like surface antigen
MFRIIIALTSLALPGSVLAASVSDMIANKQLVVGLIAGPSWISGNKTQSINLQPDIVKTYTGNNQNTSFSSAEIFVGLQQAWFATQIKQPLLAQVGVSVVGAGNPELNGDIWDDADPAFNNSTYTYKVNHTHIAIKGRLTRDDNRLIKPYLSASVGMGFNHAFNYSSSPTITEEVTAPPFKSNTTTAFTYTVGLGLQTSLNAHFQAAAGYEFADWGHVELARAAGQTQNQGLTLNHLYANQLQISLLYIA